MSLSNIFDISASGMSAQSIRLNTISSNIANAETVSSSVEETYRSRQPVFSVIHRDLFNSGFGMVSDPIKSSAGQGVEVKGIVESDANLPRRYEPHHPMADEEGYVTYPNVNIVEEMANMISSSRSFQSNVDVMEAAKSMMDRVLTIGQ